MHRIVVVGAISSDLIISLPALPKAGQTFVTDSPVRTAGGKGATQAVAAANLGAEVHLIGAVGNDDTGAKLINLLSERKVDTTHVVTTESATGVSTILATPDADNASIVLNGANADLRPSHLRPLLKLLGPGDILLTHLGVPIQTVSEALRMANRLGATTVLNPTPVDDITAYAPWVDVLVSNQRELADLVTLAGLGKMSLNKGVETLADECGMTWVIATLGAKGAHAGNGDGSVIDVASFPVRVTDSTGAGDTFIGALAYGLAAELPLREAMTIASAAGSLACTRRGAQTALPTLDDIEFLRRGENGRE